MVYIWTYHEMTNFKCYSFQPNHWYYVDDFHDAYDAVGVFIIAGLHSVACNEYNSISSIIIPDNKTVTP